MGWRSTRPAPSDGAAEDRHGAVLRPGRVHGAVRDGGPGRRRPHARVPTSRMARAAIEAQRRRRREVHRRRGRSGCSASPRPTRTTPSVPCGPALRIADQAAGLLSLDARRCACGSASTRARSSSGLASHPGRVSRSWPATAINTASRIQSVAPQGGVAVGLATFEATRDSLRLRRPAARDPEGQGRACSPSSSRRPRSLAPTVPTPRDPLRPIRRAGRRSSSSCMRVARAVPLAAARSAGHARRRTRSGQDPSRRPSSAPRSTAAYP